ncbi:hypothetical protein KR084_003186, partial [Drosophila pseudotakahashii]
METSRNILDLPLELLNQVFDYLHEHDQCALAWTHPVLEQAFIYHAGNRYNNICPSFRFKTWSYILPLCGSTVLNIEEDFHILDEFHMRLIERHCTNLQSISIGINGSNCYRVKTFLGNLKSLRSVRLWIECAATPKIFRVLKTIKYLKGLEFLRYVGREGSEICKLVHLESLTLIAHPKTTRIDVFELCSPLKKLRSLSLVGFRDCQPNEGPQDLALDELKIGSGCSVGAEWTHFPSVKTIIARFSGYTLTPGREKWILKHSESLEKLILSSGITRKQFTEILRSCKNLCYFEIDLLRLIIDITFVIQILNILKENGFTEKKPFKMYLYDQTNQFKDLVSSFNTSMLKINNSASFLL